MSRHYRVLCNGVELLERGPTGAAEPSRPWLEAFCPQELSDRPVFMVLPGGGYLRHADHEGAPVARWLNTLAINAVVLHYRVASDHPGGPLNPRPLLDARPVLAWLRSGASGLGVDPKRIGVLGFSAGGHLAATLSTGIDAGAGPATDRPDLAVLAYPVISMIAAFHAGSAESLLGPDAPAAARRAVSAELAVDGATPPTFLWHTADDGAVPVENSLSYARALARAGIPCELHVFPHGRHGLGLAGKQPGASAWPQLCAGWLDGHGWL
jgi:acetyl esterase/lipase